MFKCLRCNKVFKNNAGLVVHSNFCDGFGTKLDKKLKKPPFFCPLCGCRIMASHKTHVRTCDGIGPYKRNRPKAVPRRSWNKGKTYDDLYGPDRKKAIIEKMHNAAISRKSCSPETREKFSVLAKSRGLGGYRPGIGRGHRGRYKGVWCDSSWELAYVIYNIDNGIVFERNKDFFVYSYQGKEQKFYPDFVLVDRTYVEIKGYWSEQFSAKVEQFPGTLLIIGRQEIQPYLDYVENKYGKNFIQMYENKPGEVGERLKPAPR